MAVDPQTPLNSARRPLRGPFTRWPRATDAVLAIVVFLAAVFVATEEPNQDFDIRAFDDLSTAAVLIAAIVSGALYWRRTRPLVVLGVALAGSAASMAIGYPEGGFAVIFAVYSAGRYAENDRWNYIGLGAAAALVGLGEFLDDVVLGELAFGLFVMFLVWYIGRRIRFRGERAEQLEREQAAEARRAVAEERTRIARELHDVVAHRVSLMTVQAGAAKTVAADDPEGALRAMEAVEQAGRQALEELRQLLGVLRPDAEVEVLGPQPGLADVPRLVDQFAEAGLEVSLTMVQEGIDLPARVDLFAYRIVQEALTNVLKHAGSHARTEVRVSTNNHGVEIEVLDNGHRATILPGSGHGIVGMRERALLLGGSLDTGPRPGGGFQVVAYLPTGEEPA